MGLESAAYEILLEKQNEFDLEKFIKNIEGIELVSSESKSFKYRGVGFLGELLVKDDRLSVRFALCNSERALDWLVLLYNDLKSTNRQRIQLVETFLHKRFSSITEIDNEILLMIFREQKRIFSYAYGDADELALPASGIRKELRARGIQPKETDEEINIPEIKKSLEAKVNLKSQNSE